MIPKIIHYCWFGGKPLPALATKCINSWKKYCPDYEIKRWDETNFNIECCKYAKEAYDAKKYAFVSDYVRFKVLYEYGGLYFDTDVELIKSIEDIVAQGGFMGIERYDVKTEVNPGLGLAVAPGLGLAVAPGLGLYKELIDVYEKRSFVDDNGKLNLKTVVDYTTEVLVNHGLKNKNIIQSVGGIYIYPKEYFNPCDMDTGEIVITEKTVSIHHYAASWVDGYSLFRGKVYSCICRIMGRDFAEWLRKFVGRKK